MPLKILNFDLRHPAQFPATGAEIYSAALDICTWAEERGFARVGLAEHHMEEDGYLPCPLLFASALGGRTRRMKVLTGVVLAPLYDPARLAEEAAVTDLCLNGRLLLGMGLGTLPHDFALFGVDFRARGETMEWLVPFLRRAWTGEPFEFRGAEVRITPRPAQNPLPIILGGRTPKAIERAARIADGFHSAKPESWEIYRAACLKFGKPDPGPKPPQGPMFLWVTKEHKDRALQRLRPHLNQQIQSYVEQSRKLGVPVRGPWTPGPGEPLPYQVLDPEEAIALANSLGAKGELMFQPLLAGIEPDHAWEMLHVLEREVLPHLEH
jgi:alkanesulfonate monooxygenase SsuD/methylene tetrahydromethanopterin reductase-like flavin-dependent oxidoreductase (luciferase family)